MADRTIQLRIANRAIAIWWLLVLIGLVTYLLPGLWVMAFGLQGLTYADFELIRLGGVAVGALGMLRALHLKLSASYIVTSDSVTAKQGVFSRKTDYVRSNHIRAINVTQSFLGRILGYGDIGFASAGSNRVEVLFQGVANPLILKDRIATSLFGGRDPQDRRGGQQGARQHDRQRREGSNRKQGHEPGGRLRAQGRPGR